MADCLIDELKIFIGKQIFLTIKGQEFKPKGLLSAVKKDFIILGEERISIDSIASWKPSNGGGYHG